MNINELPATERVAVVTNAGQAEDALAQILDGCGKIDFTHWEPVSGTSQSGRIFFTKEHPGAVSLHFGPSSPADVATQIMEFRPEARYTETRPLNSVEGFEIRGGLIENHPVALVWAAWVTPEGKRE